jgi:aminocarboxymuconate-semialdehyde decarboxylase
MPNQPLTIDIHTHILPETWPDLQERYGYGGFIRLEHYKPCCARMMMDNRFFREIEDNAWDPEVRMKQCNHHHVDVQVISTVPVMFSYWAKPEHTHDLSMILNDHIAGVVSKYPNRFVGLGTLPMQSPKLAIKELERCLDIGLSGIQIGTHINEWNLDAPEIFEVLQAAETLGAAVFVHPWDMMGKDEMPKYWLPWLVGMPAETARAITSLIFSGTIERLPNLRLAFAHGGGSFPSTIGRISHGFHVRPDLCAVDNNIDPRNYLGKFYLDSLVHDPDALKAIINLIGEEKIMLGSDYPFPLGEHNPGELIKSIGLNGASKEKLLGTNALNWLDLDKSLFS